MTAALPVTETGD